MSEFTGDIAGVATTFGSATSRATSASNLSRLKTARGNVRAANNQIELEATQQQKTISRSIQQFQGSQAAARAYRGGTNQGSDSQVSQAANFQAADQIAVVESNQAAKEIAVLAANQVQFDDPVLAGIQGGLQGLNIATQIASALIDEAEVVTQQHSQQLPNTGPVNVQAPPTFENTITSILQIPGLNLADQLDLSGLNL